ncbi:MAG: hypothetical protein AB7U73_18580 [Pirellulales bacterium]
MRHAAFAMYTVLFAFLLGLAGCGQSSPPAAGGNTKGSAHAGDQSISAQHAAQAVRDFLEAVRTGSDEKATGMLTPLARQKTAETSRAVAPPASDTAKYVVGEVEMLGPDAAHVASNWTDLDEQGEPVTEVLLWIVHKCDEGWRIAGMAAKPFPDQDPLVLNFEDPEDMERKQRLAAQEYQRRLTAQTKASTNSADKGPADHSSADAGDPASPATRAAAKPAQPGGSAKQK